MELHFNKLPVDIRDLGGRTNERCIGSTQKMCMEICEQEKKQLPYFCRHCTQTVPLSRRLMDIWERIFTSVLTSLNLMSTFHITRHH